MLQDLPFVNRQFIKNTTIRQNYAEGRITWKTFEEIFNSRNGHKTFFRRSLRGFI